MPAWVAFSVVRLLEEHFPRQIDYRFTASMEEILDEIAKGDKDMTTELGEFYFGSERVMGLKPLVDGLGDIDARELATFPVGSPESGVNLRVGRYGPYIEGPGDDGTPFAVRANVPDDLPPDELTLEKAKELFANPAGEELNLGVHPETGLTVVAKSGRFGPYVTEQLPEDAKKSAKPRTASLFKSMSLPDDHARGRGQAADPAPGRRHCRRRRGDHRPERPLRALPEEGHRLPDPELEDQLLTITLEEAEQIYAQPKQRGRAAAKPPLKELGPDPVSGQPMVVKDGRFGPYVTDGEYNATLRAADDLETLTAERAAELLAEKRAKGPAKKTTKRTTKKTTKKSPAKKSTAKKTTKKAATKKS